MPAQNSRHVVYIGDKAEVELPFKRNIFRFKNRVAKQVPDDFARVLLRQDNFCEPAELTMTLAERRPGGGHAIARRWGAIGDLIMLRAAIAAFCRQRAGFTFSLRCEPRFEAFFAHDPLWKPVPPQGADPMLGGAAEPAVKCSFNQVAEQDHRGVAVHRVDLFGAVMTKQKLEIRPDDWKIPVPREAEQFVDRWLVAKGLSRALRSRKLVALQVHGSSPVKSLPREQVRALAAELAVDAEVVLIESEEREVWAAPHIHTMTGRDALHAIALLRHVDLCVCFDSGVLWMAHAAAAPVLCLMGPTRESERLTYHPLYPDGAQAVKLNELITVGGKRGCEPCFEAATACNGTHACMQRQADSTVRLIADRALSMARGEKRVALPVSCVLAPR